MKIYVIIEEIGTCPSDWKYEVVGAHTSKAKVSTLVGEFNKTALYGVNRDWFECELVEYP